MKTSLNRSQHFIDLRTLAGLALTFASLVALLILVSCAPTPVQRVYPQPKTNFGPDQQDPNLGLDHSASSAAVTSSQINWSGAVDGARVFRFAETMNELGAQENRPALIKLGRQVGDTFYKTTGTSTSNAFEKSLYISAAIGGTKDDILPLIKTNDQMLESQIPLIKAVLDQVASDFPWPAVSTPARQSLAAAKAFAKEFLAHASESKIDPDVEGAIVSSLHDDFFPLINALNEEINSILGEPRSVIMIRRLKAVAKKFDVNLGDDATKMLNRADDVMLQIEDIQSNHDALTVIVELWEMTDPANREKTFKPVSEALYNYLNGKGPSDLACVKSPNCLNPLILIPKKIGILPAIQKYGLEKLRGDLDKAAHDSLIKQISEQVALFVPTIPREINDKVAGQIALIRKKLAGVKADFPGFITGIAVEYEKQNLLNDSGADSVRLKGLEANRVMIHLGAREMAVKPIENSSNVMSGSEVIGSSMAYAASVWTAQSLSKIGYQKSVLSQINKMLALGGFITPSGDAYPSLALSLDKGASLKHFNVSQAASGGATGFAVPDAFPVAQGFNATFADGGKNVSIRAQAELLRGLSAMVRYFRDWKQNSFDSSLGAIQIGKLIHGLPAGSVKQKLFPKDTFFSLAVANGASILQNMTKDLSPVFLIDVDRKVSWANERDDDDAPATMAGLVDIVKGERTNIVHTADAARFLLAVAEFVEASTGIEKTQSAPLLKPGADGVRPVDMIVSAREKLTLLIVGIGNFISHEMAANDGGIRSSFSRDSVSADLSETRTAANQAVCILALVKASAMIGKDLYVAPALDAYAFMNRKLWNPATGFYATSESSKVLPPADEIATILLAGEALKSRMNGKSQEQWKLIAAPWMTAFEGLAVPSSH